MTASATPGLTSERIGDMSAPIPGTCRALVPANCDARKMSL
jgi:hypothetical protein